MLRPFIFIFLMCFQALALESVKIDTGRYVAIEKNIVNADETTLVFLPGIFRGFDQRDVFIQQAIKENLSFVSIHFSLQPESLLKIPSTETAYFKTHSYKASDLAAEVLTVIEKLKIKKPIIVGLSYSSAVTTELAKSALFPLIIETAPMIQYDESDPSGAKVTSFWKNYLGLNPFFGPIWTEIYLNQVYETFWSTQVDSLLKSYPEYEKAGLRSEMISAYAKLSVIVDGFDFLKQDFSTGTKRVFILGETEEHNRAVLQQQAIALYEQQSSDHDSSITVNGAGHIVPADSPKTYLKILKKFVNSN